MRYLINLSYNGNYYYGYQIQNKDITVEGQLEKVLSKVLNTSINTTPASRTDRYVHAFDQYAHFDYDQKLDTKKLTHSLNSLLDDSIYIKSIKKVSNDFHARHDVKKKEYLYKINMGEYNPIEKDYVYQYCKKIDKKTLDLFVSKISGLHNFRSFTSDKDSKSYEREIIVDYKIVKKELILRFESTGFLRYMIRNIVGLLLDINNGKKSINDIDNIFNSKDRCTLGSAAIGNALYLNKIEY